MALTARKPLLCTLLALALAPTAARADSEPPAIPVPAAGQLMATAHTIAVNRWGMDPCGGHVSVSWTHMGPGINARSQWMSTDVHNPATYTSCAITYNLDVDWDWPKLCTVVEHELGHLAGHDHVNDPHDVMSPYYVFPTRECGGQSAKRKAVKRKAAGRRSGARRPLRFGEVAGRYLADRRDLRRVAQVPLRVERRLAA